MSACPVQGFSSLVYYLQLRLEPIQKGVPNVELQLKELCTNVIFGRKTCKGK
jgi:hypothetical protein